MSSEVVPVCEPSAAGGADVGLLSLVDILVLLEVVLGGERVLAGRACERPLPCVSSFVSFQFD